MKTAIFTVVLSPAQGSSVSVDYATVDVTATAGVDYVAKSGTLVFAPGETTKNISVSVNDPVAAAIETDKSFKVVLSNIVGTAQLSATQPHEWTCRIVTSANSLPLVTTEGPIIMYGLITNAFHNEIGRGGYFPSESGTSEGQSVGIYGSFLAYDALISLGDATTAETDAANWYKANAQLMLDAIGDGGSTGAMLRQPIPTDPDTLCMLHWLFCARGSFQKQAVVYDFSAAPVGGQITIPAASGGLELFKIWRMYPTTSELLYSSPYSEAYDIEAPLNDTAVDLTSVEWTQDPSGNVTFTLPAGADTGVAEWFVIFGVNDAGLVTQGTAFEAYPCWSEIPDGYVACAPDTFRWFDDALDAAIQFDDRTGKATDWTNLRNACRRTIIKGANITDLREVLKPLPQFDVIPISGEPSGMFCYSNHPSATPPSAALQALGANINWVGYNFWSRYGGSGGEVQPGEFTWAPGNMYYTGVTGADYYNGAISLSVPDSGDATAYQVQIGRGFNDEVRAATAYQEADQFLFIAMRCSKKPGAGEKVWAFMSETKAYNGDTRYYADIGSMSAFVAESGRTDPYPCYLLIPISDFTSKDSATPTTLTAGTRLENFGLSFEMAGAYTADIVAMRLVSGPDQQTIWGDVGKYVAGSKMPFFPGSHPFATNSMIPQQQFVGWNGSPFHGYQHPDFWYKLESDVDAVHTNLALADLPIPNLSTGALEYPIVATTVTNTATKPKAAWLMEQQLYFLRRAMDKHVSLGGHDGLFAHTFVLNTPARMSLGNPTPHTWVYTNDDPNTRWTGYTQRVVEALAHLVWKTKDSLPYEDANAMALSMAVSTLTTLNTLWPNLNGVSGEDDAGNPILIYGLPTDYPAPDNSDGYGGVPLTLYEEPHAAALVLRACYWLKKSGKVAGSELAMVEALGLRCYQYLQLRWHTAADEWQYTFANFKADGSGQYYGFWIFEVIITVAIMLKDPSGNPTGVDVAQLREWLSAQYVWLSGNVVAV
jgi:hypothetical protein